MSVRAATREKVDWASALWAVGSGQWEAGARIPKPGAGGGSDHLAGGQRKGRHQSFAPRHWDIIVRGAGGAVFALFELKEISLVMPMSPGLLY